MAKLTMLVHACKCMSFETELMNFYRLLNSIENTRLTMRAVVIVKWLNKRSLSLLPRLV
ncbi:hypothetical protein BTN50_2019 [Candidatus Enterovibrio altilux]|uniref:Uncharacterized protein n=1 Tax=Candidatus Enterovibrio altilux TaxID=1927128 RepID=A0A291BBR9_9GAMM|nr:hypothetical protein BTN50_2019 [Candidatus Enterovibrio luxaltus]